MNHIVSPRPNGNRLPFLPSNFYKTYQGSALKTGTIIAKTSNGSANSKVQARLALATTPGQGFGVSEAAAASQKRRGRPAKGHQNRLKPFLATFSAPGHALAKIPQFDHIITGALYVDMGANTRPLSKKVVVRLLQRLDVITSSGVREYMGLTLRSCEVRHSQKIVQILCIIERACSKLVDEGWVDYEIDGTIEPCGNASCTVCSGQLI